MVQNLYLEGKKDEACAAIPTELIDLVTLAGTRDAVKARMRAFKDAGVGTLSITPVTFTREERLEQLRIIASIRDEI